MDCFVPRNDAKRRESKAPYGRMALSRWCNLCVKINEKQTINTKYNEKTINNNLHPFWIMYDDLC